MHDGNSVQLEEAVRRHSGESSKVTERFLKLKPSDQKALLTFLQSLVVFSGSNEGFVFEHNGPELLCLTTGVHVMGLTCILTAWHGCSNYFRDQDLGTSLPRQS